MQGSLQERAMRAGGFAACGAALGLEELAGGTLAGQLHRGLTMQVCQARCARACGRRVTRSMITWRALRPPPPPPPAH
jgi:hypothetical protein